MLIIDPSKCSGCRRCETQCSFYHSGKTGHFGARIKVEKIEIKGIDFPVVCHQCQEHYCTGCPQKAISITDRGSIEVSPTLCNLCGTCETLCPIGAIEIYNDIPYVCDLCGGTPRCVDACEMDAISYDPEIKQTLSLKSFKKQTKKMTPAMKRHKYANQATEKMRTDWLKDRRA
ncbi:4Fe-4S dicluster domain-containing protein [Desulfobacula sp.]|uniref:4Fe-4S dicluster domain-containing protein n=1 Tax=Desulfobacula sp. TaxID=2593537 RepID=UPI00261E05A0|nr:4Fe-4S dicluster domain-containing protein [Desulfobacula sp.]